MTDLPRLGVVIVTHGSADVIGDCLDTLLQSRGVALSVVVVDNDSPDATAEVVAGRRAPDPHNLRWCPTHRNGGFAAGVNHGLRILMEDAGLDRFWILNPDTLVPPDTAAAFATHAAPDGFGILGGRVIYADPPGAIQIDGGIVDWRTGRTRNLNQNADAGTAPPSASDIVFVTGASMVVSRTFVDRAGPMPEDYFLYYEEVDWALRRGPLPLLYCPDAVVRHRAGTSIGSQRPGRLASPFSEWFKHRARLRFVRRHRPASLPGAWAFTVAKAGQLVLRRDLPAAGAVLRGGFGLAPPRDVRRRMAAGGVTL
ncbi:glycosyltransferase family 2 protein [Jannaschia sp. S6380]|uniref:glycosyltransferase family 2 protein n=1 Tax=Jannaschia sp. S6380 TaxID=2926408 RepID=UPI001FF542AA|nr:glycosyltransferase family 2 protein [Jannaschia sp. S6380]MCK0168693.1 glycosyltransferase family 2 protein [Jannaschia sp. S6380]